MTSPSRPWPTVRFPSFFAALPVAKPTLVMFSISTPAFSSAPPVFPIRKVAVPCPLFRSSAAQTKAIKKVSGTTKLDLAQFRELQAFAQFGSDLDEQTKAKINRGQRIVELFKQNQYSPLGMEMEVAILWAMQHGHFDHVEVERVKECQGQLEEFLTTRKPDLLQKIADEKALTDEISEGLKTALTDFKATWK